ncbi:ABC transporter permease subunit [Ureibacillus sp. FSL K6-8385]|uniref:ABC transporter permease n=1 Tax=Ureibacillus sp. FSL K6-8385 TaxID=2954684 RepID=UPI0031585B90
MRTFAVLFQKELRESWRSFKFLWMPLLFIFLGISDPIMNYYMEDILNAVGNLPEGFTITLPDYAPADILLASTGQFQSIGLIVLVVIAAGMINRERQNGTALFIYVRPISFAALYFSKWAVINLLAVLSVILGYGASMYYTAILYGAVEPLLFIQMVASYCVWILFATTIALMFSAMFKTALSITFTVIVLPIGVLVQSLIGQFWNVSPWKLADYSVQLLTQSENEYYLKTLLLTIICTVIFILIGILFTRKNASSVKV